MKKSTILLLTAIAGYIDTISFICSGSLFAAHVTGNFVVFGASLAHGVEEKDYIKLISFPIFVLFVGIGVMIFGISSKQQWRMAEAKLVLLFQAWLFLIAGILSYTMPGLSNSYLGLILVGGMGLQNSLHRYLPGPMTTVMTGTVMNWAASHTEGIFRLPKPETKPGAPKPFTGLMIIAFSIGCALGGLLASQMSLQASLVPGVALMLLVVISSKREGFSL